MDLSWDHSIRDIVTTVVALDCSKSKDPSMRGELLWILQSFRLHFLSSFIWRMWPWSTMTSF